MTKGVLIKVIFLVLLSGGAPGAFAQAKKFSLPAPDPLLFAGTKGFFLLSVAEPPLVIHQDFSFSTTFHASPRPLFCSMEDKLHKRLNVWIVLRAGSDADYRKMIATPAN